MAEQTTQQQLTTISELNPKPALLPSDKTAVENAEGTYYATLQQQKDFFNQGMQPSSQPVITLEASFGTVTLEDGKIYKMAASAAVTFVLPEITDAGVHHQIKVFLSLSGNAVISWDTEVFFNREAPEFEQGNYVVYFDYVPALNAWAVGAMQVGSAL